MLYDWKCKSEKGGAKLTLGDAQLEISSSLPSDRVCSHKQRIAYVDWVEGIAELSARLPKGESITSAVYYAYPFRKVCPDCQYVVFSRGPDSLKNT